MYADSREGAMTESGDVILSGVSVSSPVMLTGVCVSLASYVRKNITAFVPFAG